MIIIKRSGKEVSYDETKILNAITKANESVQEEFRITEDKINSIVKKITNFIKKSPIPISVEDIQDKIETELINLKSYHISKNYIKYRFIKELSRDKYKSLMTNVAEKLTAANVQNQNANVDEKSFGGRTGEATDLITKRYALEYLVSPMAKNNHLNNEIYIHDLNSYSVGCHNCLSIPFDDLLAKGFNTRQTDVRPANSVNTAFQLMAVIFQLQSLQQFGGVAATHVDHTMVPYVRKSFKKHLKNGIKYFDIKNEEIVNLIESDELISFNNELIKSDEKLFNYAYDMTEKETYQAVEAMYHNLNTLQSRSGNQLPFTSINYGTCTEPEGRLVTTALLDVSIKGIGKAKRTSIFPCGIFQCMEGVNRKEGDPNYDLFKKALLSTSLRLYPNYANCNWSGNAGFDINDPRTYFSTMGCRTANGWDINGFGQLKDGRGNICPVTIILPTLAMKAGRDVEKFMLLLDVKIHEAKKMLMERFEWICSQPAESAGFMYENNLMAGYVPSEGIRSALKHGTLALGQLGLAETLELLIGKNQLTEEGMELAKRIEGLFKKRCAEFKEQEKLNFGVYYTPAENLCYTAMTKFREQFGIIPKVSDKKFFTNSIHVPVWEQIGPFQKIDVEAQLTGFSSAGCITYVELDAATKHNVEALEVLVNYAMDKDIPYFAVNVPNDQCIDCGYIGDIGDECPVCKSGNIKHLARVTGYLTGDYKSAFNIGKQEEVSMRVKHNKFAKRFDFDNNESQLN